MIFNQNPELMKFKTSLDQMGLQIRLDMNRRMAKTAGNAAWIPEAGGNPDRTGRMEDAKVDGPEYMDDAEEEQNSGNSDGTKKAPEEKTSRGKKKRKSGEHRAKARLGKNGADKQEESRDVSETGSFGAQKNRAQSPGQAEEAFPSVCSAGQCSAEVLRQAVLWSEVLGEPVSKKRRKDRVSRQYGNQSNAYRR